jgi:hypothetical protein
MAKFAWHPGFAPQDLNSYDPGKGPDGCALQIAEIEAEYDPYIYVYALMEDIHSEAPRDGQSGPQPTDFEALKKRLRSVDIESLSTGALLWLALDGPSPWQAIAAHTLKKRCLAHPETRSVVKDRAADIEAHLEEEFAREEAEA